MIAGERQRAPRTVGCPRPRVQVTWADERAAHGVTQTGSYWQSALATKETRRRRRRGAASDEAPSATRRRQRRRSNQNDCRSNQKLTSACARRQCLPLSRRTGERERRIEARSESFSAPSQRPRCPTPSTPRWTRQDLPCFCSCPRAPRYLKPPSSWSGRGPPPALTGRHARRSPAPPRPPSSRAAAWAPRGGNSLATRHCSLSARLHSR